MNSVESSSWNKVFRIMIITSPVLILIILLLGQFWVWYSSRTIISHIVVNENTGTAEQILMRIDMLLYERGKDLAHLGSLSVYYPSETSAQSHFITDATGIITREHLYYGISFIDTAGKVSISVPAKADSFFWDIDNRQYIRHFPRLAGSMNNLPVPRLLSIPTRISGNSFGIVVFVPAYESTGLHSFRLKGMVGGILYLDDLIGNTVKLTPGAFDAQIHIDDFHVYPGPENRTHKVHDTHDCSEVSRKIDGRKWSVFVCAPRSTGFIRSLNSGNNMRFMLNIIASLMVSGLLAMLLISYNHLQISRERITASEEAYKNVAEEREKLIKELESRNADLERFTYTVSHELKTPLITIRGFLGYLEKEAGEGDLEHLHKDITHIVSATETMRRLLNGLIEVIKISRKMKEPEVIPFESLANETAEIFKDQLKERRIILEIQPALPSVHGDRSSLLELLKILMENAIKFMGNQPEPHITIGIMDYNSENAFYIRDNGAGFDPKYQERIFGLFNKLDPSTEGTGVGLALARRIVLLHNGWIRAESEGPGRGTTIVFKLPVHEQRPGEIDTGALPG